MPETKAKAIARAKALGMPKSQVVKGEKGYFIAPAGVEKAKAKRAYAGCREKGGEKGVCAAVAYKVQKGK